jgi:hypothetical protein
MPAPTGCVLHAKQFSVRSHVPAGHCVALAPSQKADTMTSSDEIGVPDPRRKRALGVLGLIQVLSTTWAFLALGWRGSSTVPCSRLASLMPCAAGLSRW